MSIDKLCSLIFLSIAVTLCGQVVAQDGSGTAAAPAAEAAPTGPDENALKDKFGMVMGYRFARRFKSQNPDASYAEILEGIKASERGEDKKSFVYGYQMMERMKEQKVGLSAAQLEAGFKKAMAGEELGMSDQETQMLAMAFGKLVEQKQIAEMKKTTEDNKAKGAAYIAAQKAANPNVKELSDGIYYEVLKEGTGGKAGPQATVSVDYTGSFVDGEVFDSSVKPLDGGPGKPADFQVGRVIPGFTKALLAMPVGSKWRVLIPGDQAYGIRGSGGKIGPMQTLVFEVELLKIVSMGEEAAPSATPPVKKPVVAPAAGK